MVRMAPSDNNLLIKVKKLEVANCLKDHTKRCTLF